MVGGEIGAGVKLGRRQNAAVRSGMAVIFRATADTGFSGRPMRPRQT